MKSIFEDFVGNTRANCFGKNCIKGNEDDAVVIILRILLDLIRDLVSLADVNDPGDNVLDHFWVDLDKLWWLDGIIDFVPIHHCNPALDNGMF